LDHISLTVTTEIQAQENTWERYIYILQSGWKTRSLDKFIWREDRKDDFMGKLNDNNCKL
jgi:hypothetical protein